MTRSRELAELGSAYDSGSSLGFRNRIINGDMRIDQRNNGASVTLNNTASYTLDRWYDRCIGGAGSAVITVQRSTVAPAGFTNSSLITVTTSKTPAASEQFWRYQAVEGFNAADLAFGSASASTVTLSFWVRSSVTGTYSVALQNSAQNRSYVATYIVNAANTWEQKTVTVAGDTSGTWLTDNGVGLYVFFDTGSGSNYNTTAGAWGAGTFYRTSGSVSLISNSGATFYITGVQLEAGTVATPFERRPYGTELALCQRYYEFVGNGASGTLNSGNTGPVSFTTFWKVTKRAGPTVAVGYGAVQGADIASAVTYQGNIGAGSWYFPQGVTASAEL